MLIAVFYLLSVSSYRLSLIAYRLSLISSLLSLISYHLSLNFSFSSCVFCLLLFILERLRCFFLTHLRCFLSALLCRWTRLDHRSSLGTASYYLIPLTSLKSGNGIKSRLLGLIHLGGSESPSGQCCIQTVAFYLLIPLIHWFRLFTDPVYLVIRFFMAYPLWPFNCGQSTCDHSTVANQLMYCLAIKAPARLGNRSNFWIQFYAQPFWRPLACRWIQPVATNSWECCAVIEGMRTFLKPFDPFWGSAGLCQVDEASR